MQVYCTERHTIYQIIYKTTFSETTNLDRKWTICKICSFTQGFPKKMRNRKCRKKICMKHVCCDDRIMSKNVSYDCDEFKAPIISRTARFVEKSLVAVGKDPRGVVVSKCVHCPRGCGIQVVSLWYPTGISSSYLSHLTTITRSMVIWRPTTPEMIPNPSGCSS